MPVFPGAVKPAPTDEIAPVVAEQQTLGVRHIAFDIETMHASKKEIDAVISFHKPTWNAKDPKDQAKKFAEKTKEKSALLDAAPIGCVVLITERGTALFSCIDPKSKLNGKGLKGIDGQVWTFKTERDMLIGMRAWLNPRTILKTTLIGFNLFYFDLPKLRAAYVRHRLILPVCLNPEVRDAVVIYDVMKKFLYGFTTEKAGQKYISLEEVSARLGLPTQKSKVESKDMPDLIAKKKEKEVLTFCYLDVVPTYLAFLLMTGQIKEEV